MTQGERPGTDAPSEPLEGPKPALTLIWTSSLQNREATHLLLKPPSLWHFLWQL